jgi:hypothetical protein
MLITSYAKVKNPPPSVWGQKWDKAGGTVSIIGQFLACKIHDQRGITTTANGG